MANDQITVLSIYGEETTGASPETILLVVDGVSGDTIPVPEGTNLVITDILLNSEDSSLFSLEVDRGSGFSPIAYYGINSPTSTGVVNLKTGILVKGGPGVVFRVRVLTPIGTLVSVTLRAYLES